MPAQMTEFELTRLQTFVEKYLTDAGACVQIVEQIALAMPGSAELPKLLFNQAVADVCGTGVFVLEEVTDGALSLDFIVRYARRVGLPSKAMPSKSTVDALLMEFHASKGVS